MPPYTYLSIASDFEYLMLGISPLFTGLVTYICLMNAVHLHLMLTHFPIVGFILFVPVLAWGILKKNRTILQLACTALVVLAAISVVVLNTGEGAEEAVEHLPGISHDLIHEHEEAGELAFWFLALSGSLSLLLLVFRWDTEKPKNYAYYLLLVLAVAAASLSIRAGSLGGDIRHPEKNSQWQPGDKNENFPASHSESEH